jgi:hypothetical protein
VSPQKAWLVMESKNNWESAVVIDINPFNPSDSIAAVTIQDQYQMHVLPFSVFDLVNDEKAHQEEFILREIEFSKEDSEDDTLWLGLTLQVFVIVVVLAWRIQTPKLSTNYNQNKSLVTSIVKFYDFLISTNNLPYPLTHFLLIKIVGSN